MPGLLIFNAAAMADTTIASAVLPNARSVAVNQPATLYTSVINAGTQTAVNCRITVNLAGISFSYQSTDPTSNTPIGPINTPVNIPPQGVHTFVLTLSANTPLEEVIRPAYRCDNTPAAEIVPGVNTFEFSASDMPVADVVALVATVTQDGVVYLDPSSGTGAFSVATINLGAQEDVTVSVAVTPSNLGVAVSFCETHPVTSACKLPPLPSQLSMTSSFEAGASPTFGVFLSAGEYIDFDPVRHRVYLRFRGSSNQPRGSTSVAVSTASAVP